MAVQTNKSNTTSNRTKADGYATIVVMDKNGIEHRIESQDAWLFASKNTGEINPVNSSLLKKAQQNRIAYQTFQTLDAKERGKLIAKGEEPKPYIEIPAVIQVKVPAPTHDEEVQVELDF